MPLMHPQCFVYYDKTWMKTVLTCFTFKRLIAEQPCLTQYERPMYHYDHYERKINMLSSTDKKVICLFDLRDLLLNLGFPFLYTHTVYGGSYRVYVVVTWFSWYLRGLRPAAALYRENYGAWLLCMGRYCF